MEVTGLILEMVLPGLLVLASVYITAWEFKLLNQNAFKGDTAGLLTIAVLTFAYIIGVVVRHFAVLKRPAYHYSIRMETVWRPLADELLQELTETLKISNVGKVYLPRIWHPISEDERYTEEQSQELISYLRDCFLSTKEGAISDYLMYEWKIARLARNCHLPLLFIAAACLVATAHRIILTDWLNSAYHALNTLACIGLAIGMNKVYRERLYWHVDILMRIAAIEFGRPIPDAHIPRPMHFK